MKLITVLALATAIAGYGGVATAADPAKGETTFKRCRTCHSIVAPDGTEIVKGGKVGPNLYGVVGRQVASIEGFSYGKSLAAVGDTGMVWDEASIAVYVTDPKAWLAETLGDPGAATKMAFKLNAGAEDVAAYLASVGN